MKKIYLLVLFLLTLVGCTNTNTTTNNTTSEQSQSSTQLKDLKQTQHFLPSALAHIFEGEINRNNQAVGYHYEGLKSAKAKLIESTTSKPNALGIYRSKITINGVEKKAYSTFFPKKWTPQQVIDAINEAYESKKLQTGNLYQGKSKSGVTIQMYLTDQQKIISAFPLYEK